MRVVAILAVHDERPYFANCLSHLIANGIDFAVVDNGSTDGSAELLRESVFAPHLVGYSHVPFAGEFVWQEIMLAQEQLVSTIDADWILLVAPDEIMHSNRPGETLASAIERLDAQGYNVINFDEFHFLPIVHNYLPDHRGVQPLRHYYFFKMTKQPVGMRARKKSSNLSSITSGGHVMSGADLRLAPESLVHRHYIVRSQTHAYEKYTRRVYDAKEVARGWHWHGFKQPVGNFTFPPADQLECLATPEDRNLSRNHPHDKPYWQWKS